MPFFPRIAVSLESPDYITSFQRWTTLDDRKAVFHLDSNGIRFRHGLNFTTLDFQFQARLPSRKPRSSRMAFGTTSLPALPRVMVMLMPLEMPFS